MKSSYTLLALVFLNCSSNEVNFPESEIKIIDPLGPSKNYKEKLYKSKVVNFESVGVMPCRRNIYKGTTEQQTILITRHCVDGSQGWFYAERFFFNNKNARNNSNHEYDNNSEDYSKINNNNRCDVTAETVVGGLYLNDWRCVPNKKSFDEVMEQAEGWLNDPSSILW